MYSTAQIITLAKAYLIGTEMAVSTLGVHVAGNDKLFSRLFEGFDCLASSIEAASDWFDLNWPRSLEWPREVPRRQSLRRGRTTTVRSGRALVG